MIEVFPGRRRDQDNDRRREGYLYLLCSGFSRIDLLIEKNFKKHQSMENLEKSNVKVLIVVNFL